jgi:hypothetical protein
MIDKNLPEPDIKECVYCGRKTGKLKGQLLHWPNEDCTKSQITLINETKIEPFSMWIYECQYCRGVKTKKLKKGSNNGK